MEKLLFRPLGTRSLEARGPKTGPRLKTQEPKSCLKANALTVPTLCRTRTPRQAQEGPTKL
eukprot:9488995-Pyramimonas_sp.AAC.1